MPSVHGFVVEKSTWNKSALNINMREITKWYKKKTFDRSIYFSYATDFKVILTNKIHYKSYFCFVPAVFYLSLKT